MIATSTDEPAAPALQAAVDSLDVAVAHLIKLVDDGALGDLGAFGLVRHCRPWNGSATSCPSWTGR